MYVAYKAPKKQTRSQAVRLLAKQFVERHQNKINPAEKPLFKQLKKSDYPVMKTPA